MTHNGSLIGEPYEVIETEEKITREFSQSRDSKYPTFSSTTNRPKHNQLEQNFYEQGDPKVVLKNYQFQALCEKFNKLSVAMSELTEKFKEINMEKENSPAFNYSDTGAHFNSNGFCAEINLQENQLDNANISDCKSCVSQSQTEPLQPELPISRKVIDNKSQCRGFANGETNRSNENDNIPKPVNDAPLLKKSKEILVRLIDNELQRVQPSQTAISTEKSMVNVPMSFSNSKHLKLECIDKITEELAILRDLEGIYGS